MRALIRILLGLGCLFLAVVILLGIIFRDRRPRIVFAAEDGDTNAIALYLASGSNVNANINCYPFSEHVLHAPLLDVAIRSGQIETIDFLLKKGPGPNQPDSKGDTPLIWVFGIKNDVPRERRMLILKMLLKAGADPNAPATGYTPLIEAAVVGEAEMARVLLDAGADVNATNQIGQTALHLVGNPEVARLLLAAGANIRARDAHGETPVDCAMRDGYTNILAVLTNVGVLTNR